MQEETGISRKKRLVLGSNSRHRKHLLSGSRGHTLTFTYDYLNDKDGLYRHERDPSYSEMVEVAVENFNALGLAHLTYKPFHIVSYDKRCPLDMESLKLKYGNHIIFSYRRDAEYSGSTRYICDYKSRGRFYEYFLPLEEENRVELPPFSIITCNIASPAFQQYGVGILLHELNHAIGLAHSHQLDETNGILHDDIRKPSLEKLEKGGFGRNYLVYGFSSFFPIAPYTPATLFSMQHYGAKGLAPYRSVNKTRIREILAGYGSTEQLISEYFYLFEKNFGLPYVYTYQDISSIATAIYQVAPHSLIGKKLNLRDYYLVSGIYIQPEDKAKLSSLIANLKVLENFTYPIFHSKKAILNLESSHWARTDLKQHLKLASLEGELHCKIDSVLVSPLIEGLFLQEDCLLRHKIATTGNFQFNIAISNRKSTIVLPVHIRVKKQVVPMDRVLLGKPRIHYVMKEGEYIDLSAICQAVAVPDHRFLTCDLDAHVHENLQLRSDCWLQVVDQCSSRNLSVTFSNGMANKICHIQFLGSCQSSLPSVVVPKPKFKRSSDLGYSDGQVEWFSKWCLQFGYYAGVPCLQGVWEGAADSLFHSSSQLKWLVKLLPRVTLLGCGYLSFLSFFLASAGSFLARLIPIIPHQAAEKFVHAVIFFTITELEYGFSNLWELADKPLFWPALTDKLNQLIVQCLLSPSIKGLGYWLTVISIGYLYSANTLLNTKYVEVSTPLLDANKATCNNAQTDQSCSFFTAIKTAARTVFSPKTGRLVSVFFNQMCQMSQTREVALPNALRSR